MNLSCISFNVLDRFPEVELWTKFKLVIRVAFPLFLFPHQHWVIRAYINSTLCFKTFPCVNRVIPQKNPQIVFLWDLLYARQCSVLYTSSHLVLVTTLQGRYYCYDHFADEKLRHQTLSPVISPRSESQKVGQPRLSQKVQLQSHTLNHSAILPFHGVRATMITILQRRKLTYRQAKKLDQK